MMALPCNCQRDHQGCGQTAAGLASLAEGSKREHHSSRRLGLLPRGESWSRAASRQGKEPGDIGGVERRIPGADTGCTSDQLADWKEASRGTRPQGRAAVHPRTRPSARCSCVVGVAPLLCTVVSDGWTLWRQMGGTKTRGKGERRDEVPPGLAVRLLHHTVPYCGLRVPQEFVESCPPSARAHHLFPQSSGWRRPHVVVVVVVVVADGCGRGGALRWWRK
jgi:hypothetical protein